MALTQRLDMRQGQSLVMTPQLQQAIKLLQMSNFELREFVESELEKNPLLERPDNEAVSLEPTPEPASATEPETPLPNEGDVSKTLENLDTDLGNVYADEARADADDRHQPAQMDSSWSTVGTSDKGGSFDREGINYENILSSETTLAEHLSSQLSLAISSPGERMIGQYLIGTLTDSGYLGTDIAAAAQALGTDEQTIERVLAVLKTFEPTGVFATDLKDCLKVQLQEKDRLDPAMAILIDNLELVAKREFNKLKKLTGLEMEDIYDMVGEIRELDPKPGLAFGDVAVQPVVPDVIVRAAPDGSWIVELNSETLPRVLVNNQYQAMVSSGSTPEKDRIYISECHNAATWLVKSLEQRARTILAVSREIVRQQDAFLVSGVMALKPLNLRNIAEVIDMHESTVSRVTSNKFIQTPRGLFELKYFFSTAISSLDGGTDYSAEAIRNAIRELIDAETVDAVLSDDAIVENLKARDVDIARRTVAKYREAMKIPSSVQRRREKRAMI